MSDQPIGAKIDALEALRDRVADARRNLDALQASEAELQRDILASLEAAGIDSASGGRLTVSRREYPKPTIRDWQELWAHIAATGEFDLMRRQLSDGAIKARWDAGATVPGVGIYNHVALSVTTRRR